PQRSSFFLSLPSQPSRMSTISKADVGIPLAEEVCICDQTSVSRRNFEVLNTSRPLSQAFFKTFSVVAPRVALLTRQRYCKYASSQVNRASGTPTLNNPYFVCNPNPVGGPRSYTGGGIPPTTLAGSLVAGTQIAVQEVRILDGVSSLLPLGGGSPGGGVNDILNGVPRFKPAVSTATPDHDHTGRCPLDSIRKCLSTNDNLSFRPQRTEGVVYVQKTCHQIRKRARQVKKQVDVTGGNGQQAWSRVRSPTYHFGFYSTDLERLQSPYAQYLPRQGFSPCWWIIQITYNPCLERKTFLKKIPHHVFCNPKSTGDVQLTAEYVAYAIKYLSTQSRPADQYCIIQSRRPGLHAMGPESRSNSSRLLISLLPVQHSGLRRKSGKEFCRFGCPFHGTTLASVVCPLLDVIGGCLPALFQMISSSRLVKALNAPVPGSGARALVPTTSVYSRNDEIVVPQTGSRPISALDGASNIAVQDICGVTHVADHFLLIGDLAAYSIAVDALMSGRPANPATVDNSLGGQAASLGNDLKYAFATLIGNTNDRISSLLKTATTLLYVCRRGFATGCTGNGFSAPQDRDPLLNNLPTMVNGVGSLLGGLVR
ncbi:hypothetical protein PSTT_13270, partial [Puccinia striiformis]